jgi:hypothetical protein
MNIKHFSIMLCILSGNTLLGMKTIYNMLHPKKVTNTKNETDQDKEIIQKPILIFDLSIFNLAHETLQLIHPKYQDQFLDTLKRDYGKDIDAGIPTSRDQNTLMGAMVGSLLSRDHFNPYDLLLTENVTHYNHNPYYIKTETEEFPRSILGLIKIFSTLSLLKKSDEKEVPPFLSQAFFIKSPEEEKSFWESVTEALKTKEMTDMMKKLVLTKLKTSFLPPNPFSSMHYSTALEKVIKHYKDSGYTTIFIGNAPYFYNDFIKDRNKDHDKKFLDHILISNETGYLTTDIETYQKIFALCNQTDPKNYIVITSAEKNLRTPQKLDMPCMVYKDLLDLQQQIAIFARELNKKKDNQ